MAAFPRLLTAVFVARARPLAPAKIKRVGVPVQAEKKDAVGEKAAVCPQARLVHETAPVSVGPASCSDVLRSFP